MPLYGDTKYDGLSAADPPPESTTAFAFPPTMAIFLIVLGFRGRRALVFLSRTIDSAATLRMRAVSSALSTVRSRPSPSRIYKRLLLKEHGTKLHVRTSGTS